MTTEPVIQYSKWLAIPLSTRAKIAEKFGVAKTRSTSVIDNVVVDDGYEIHAVETAVNRKALQEFLNSDEADINALLQHLVEVMEGRVEIVKADIVEESSTDNSVETETASSPKVPKKKSTKTK